MSELIAAEQLPQYVPGKVLFSSDTLGWKGVKARSYRYTGLDVFVPPMSEYMIVAYRNGLTPMQRQFDGHWSREQCVPGDISLLTRAEASHWYWTRDIDVVHIYLTRDLLARVSSEVMDRDIVDVRLQDVLKTNDNVIYRAADAIAAEAQEQGMGGPLYAEAVATQMAVHLLRRYSSVSSRQRCISGSLSPRRARRVVDYIESRLDSALRLEDLAAEAGLSTWHFLRQFRRRFGCAPHAFVIERRIARARKQLLQGALPIKEIAANCGFSDQAHMTRLFRRHLGVTPASVRSSS